MGCDIHLFAEVKKKRNIFQRLMFWKPKQWVNIDKWEKNKHYDKEGSGEPYWVISDRFYSGGRNYNLFCALCGVRSGSFYGEPPIISEPKGLPIDVSMEVQRESVLWGTDGHSHNWNTLKELKQFDWSSYGETVKYFLDEVIPKMEAQNVSDEDVRIVYFFDN